MNCPVPDKMPKDQQRAHGRQVLFEPKPGGCGRTADAGCEHRTRTGPCMEEGLQSEHIGDHGHRGTFRIDVNGDERSLKRRKLVGRAAGILLHHSLQYVADGLGLRGNRRPEDDAPPLRAGGMLERRSRRRGMAHSQANARCSTA
jgi:hypothetical protein